MAATKIIDATLREGSQAPGVLFGLPQSTYIAKLLAAVGVDMIECGHAISSEAESKRIRAVANLQLGVPLLSHARARREDIAAAKDSGSDWVGIFCGVNKISRLTRLRDKTPESIIDMVQRTVAYAKSLDLRVRYTVEDGTRTPIELVLKVLSAAVEAGADRICYADTLGAIAPSAFGETIRCIRQSLPRVDLEVHVHDDRGFAIANAWMAIETGPTWVSTSVNGVGERCGITDLATLLANLDVARERPLRNAAALQHLCQYVAAATRSPPDHRRPVSGKNAFTHTARLHTKAMEKSPLAYAVFDAEHFGRSIEIAAPPTGRELAKSVVRPKVISSTELKYHRSGPGTRYVMVDDRFVDDARQYCIVRDIPHQSEPAEAHVDAHRHVCDSLFMFIGKEAELKGLTVEVLFDGETQVIESPAAVFIPAGIEHSYRVLHGSGLYVNHVLSGNYNASLLDKFDHAAEHTPSDGTDTMLLIRDYVARIKNRSASGLTPDTELLDSGVIDSLAMLDLFLYLEQVTGEPIPEEKVKLEAFRTIRSIHSAFVAHPRTSPPAA